MPLNKEQIALTAFQTVDPQFEDETDAEYRQRVLLQAMLIATSLNPGNFLMQMLDALESSTPFPAIVLGWELEETSQRYVVSIKTNLRKGEDAKIETIRTERVDGKHGPLVKAMLHGTKNKRVLVYKSMEPMAGSSTPKNVRVLTWLQVLD